MKKADMTSAKSQSHRQQTTDGVTEASSDGKKPEQDGNGHENGDNVVTTIRIFRPGIDDRLSIENSRPVRYADGSDDREIRVHGTLDRFGNQVRLGDTVRTRDALVGTVIALTLSPDCQTMRAYDTCAPVRTYDFAHARWVARIHVQSDDNTSYYVVYDDVRSLERIDPTPEYGCEHHQYSARDLYDELESLSMSMSGDYAERVRRIMRHAKSLL